MRKIFTLFAAVLCAASMFASVSEEAMIGDIYYRLDNETMTASVYELPEGQYSGAITIPPKVEYNNKPYTVTKIGQSAFMRCSELSSVTLPPTLLIIDLQAFRFSGLTSIDIPASVTEIVDAFSSCTKMTAFNVDPANANYASVDGVLYTKDMKTLIQCPLARTENLVVPDGVERLEEGSFYDLVNRINLTLPASMKSIGTVALYYVSLNSLTCYAVEPPALEGENSIRNMSVTEGTFVLAESVDAYNATDWKYHNIKPISDAAITNPAAGSKAVKRVVNGMLMIERGGKMFDVTGAEVK